MQTSQKNKFDQVFKKHVFICANERLEDSLISICMKRSVSFISKKWGVLFIFLSFRFVIRAIREVKKIRRFSISDFSTTLHRKNSQTQVSETRPDLQATQRVQHPLKMLNSLTPTHGDPNSLSS